MANQIINLTLERYEELLAIEARTNASIEFIGNDKYCEKEMILRILGTEKAIEEADKLRAEDEQRHRAYFSRKTEEQNVDL